MEQIVDTNVILRYLVGDIESQYQNARKLFENVQKGKSKLIIKALVISEVVFVLESFYKNNREDIAESMETFLSQKWLRVEEREVLLSLWDFYRRNLHFVDSYLLSWAEVNKGKIASFDKKLLNNLSRN
ncbi:MAG: hypothetical protein ACD_57C00350G0013 [uncultured bacterium]|uniref:PIN domain-containing protein n=1 Tax=Candidatus Woesebacteria bacterium RIFCSPHIGHO2_12_FULL_41_24 TaxID=1802510 RepID=A0A1F8ATI1_9BACT|nr:MAG: hypothetical protein ACD_57C00350G0013 [uncultured bacterium]OGM14808.1 MAG: hypothetical protein A2W15_00520 [Candidatus Woesebacteria bacterium RBG_16_41_13]OGM30301.1 MAG: hypothetical protein A2873_05225 [Candidatus Woesebacteria bacterium RIFCSPHIGHO2_01_FULL_42_80]OGM34340.1 MAG: hypothetical protein A3D84_04810 [Candidatus Woesebacteria bacterium RIFCSPHIGHO2_02_FULL_42_20]OGM54991.1 MAG: hypothetical protein A3E44_05080 [Candidatus Woesebacteria bacterium RIFCSPHIGHO2_12_FULL_41